MVIRGSLYLGPKYRRAWKAGNPAGYRPAHTHARRHGRTTRLPDSLVHGNGAAPLADTAEFLKSTYGIVPAGAESDFIDLDNELDDMLWQA